mgnify:FL=1|tara:strand:- start:13 stop:144 length:132 start_codon:yes stop_codon:yes gene_type:complete
MIKDIISLLKIVDKETENIKIAKGKNKLATTWSEAFKQIKEAL